MELVMMVYAVTEKLPEKEKFGLTTQLNRCSVSIPSNIAEGWGKQNTGNFVMFLNHAKGSLCELETQMMIVNRLDFINDSELKNILEITDEISGMLNSLVSSLKGKEKFINAN